MNPSTALTICLLAAALVSAEDLADATERFRRFAPGQTNYPGSVGNPGNNRGNNGGTWDIGVDKGSGRGPQVHAGGQGTIYTSPGGNVKVDANGRWEAGKGRKPSLEGGVTVHGKWKREANDRNGQIDIRASQSRRQGESVRAEVTKDLWRSKDGNTRVEARAHYEKNRRGEDKGGSVVLTHRWRREAKDDSRGSVSVTREQTRGQKPVYRAEGSGRVWQSQDRKGQVNVNGNYQRGGGMRPSYGAGVTYTRRFRRDAELKPESEVANEETTMAEEGAEGEDLNEESLRVRRQAGDRGSVSVTREQTRGQKPVYRAEGSGRVWQSQDKKGQVNVNGNYQRGGGMRPSYGAGVTYTRRFRRDADLEPESEVANDEVMAVEEEVEGEELNEESLRVRRQAGDRGSVSVTREQTRGQKPVYRADANAKVWQSQNGRSRVDVNGNYQRGGGMKPNYGAGVQFTHRFRRDVEFEPETEDQGEVQLVDEEGLDEEAEVRVRRQSGDRGSVSVTREQTRGQKPVYRADANARVWQSQNGRSRFDVNGNYQRGGGMRPNYGAGVTFTHRFRREAEDLEEGEELEPLERVRRQSDRGSLSITRQQNMGQKPIYRADGSANVWKNDNNRVDLNGNYQRGGGMPHSFGGGATYSGNRGSASLGVDKMGGQRPTYSAQGSANVWESRNGNSRVTVDGNYQRGGGMRPNYGVGATFTSRFRREINEE